MRKTSGIMILLILVGMLEITSFATAQFVPDPGVCGIVSANDVPLEGVSIRMDNLDNGEYREQTTAFENPPHSTAGGYAFCMPAEIGDTMQLTVYYNGTEYYGTTIVVYVDFDDPINWFNLSIDANAPPLPPPDPPVDPPVEPPVEPPIEPPVEPPEDPPVEPPVEPPIEPEIQFHNLTVIIFDNVTEMPINNASVIIYDPELDEVNRNHTNESGMITFQLEEGDYVIVAEKDDYIIKRGAVNLLASIEYTLLMNEGELEDESVEFGTVQQNVQGQNPLIIYTGMCCIIVVIVVTVLMLWRKGWIWKSKKTQ